MKKLFPGVILCLALSCICSRAAFSAEEKLIIGLVPEVNRKAQIDRYFPLIKYLEKKVGVKVGMKYLPNYGATYEEMRDGLIEGGFLGSFVYCMTRAHVQAEPIARPVRLDGVSTCTGYTFVRKDSGIKSPRDMKGKTIALVDPLSTSGYLAQRLFFTKHGIDINKDVKIFWVGSHDAAVMAVFNKQADMGGAKNHVFDKLVLENAAVKEALIILDESPAVPDNVLAVSKDLNPKIKEKVKNVFATMASDPVGQGILRKFGARAFIETKDEDYKDLYGMIKKAGIDLMIYSYSKDSVR
ncbi:MAG: phosphate/phosphite/phosphonate ABC transporter substrate-binding protein [Thermodesulfovibrionales bacterium]|jgi:phosphonate transport system substrate-binding protein